MTALVFPKDVISRFTIEKLFEEFVRKYQDGRRLYFDTFEQAYEWIKNVK